MITGVGGGSVMKVITLLLSGLMAYIGLNILAQPLATAVVEAKLVPSAAYLATFLGLVPLFVAIGAMTAMFWSSGGLGGGGNEGGMAIIMKIVAAIVGAVAAPLLFIQLGDVVQTYALNVCTVKTLTAVTGSVVECALSDIYRRWIRDRRENILGTSSRRYIRREVPGDHAYRAPDIVRLHSRPGQFRAAVRCRRRGPGCVQQDAAVALKNEPNLIPLPPSSQFRPRHHGGA